LRQQSQYYGSDRDDHVAKANKALSDVIIPARTARATLDTLQCQVEELQNGLTKLRKENEKSTNLLILIASHSRFNEQKEIVSEL